MSSLCLHNSKFDSKLIALDDLRAMPAPEPLSPFHKPIHHADLVDAILAEADRRDLRATKTQFGLGAKGAALFGVIDFQPKDAVALVTAPVEVPSVQTPGTTGISLGFRAGNDYSLALKGVAGQRVFVCDNLALSGDMFAFARKHTTGMDLYDVIARGFDVFATQATDLAKQIAKLEGEDLTDDQAKLLIYEVFAGRILPVKLFDDVIDLYFDEATLTHRPDCQPRTKFGVHNAMTRTVKQLSPVPAFEATQKLGRFFGLTNQEAMA